MNLNMAQLFERKNSHSNSMIIFFFKKKQQKTNKQKKKKKKKKNNAKQDRNPVSCRPVVIVISNCDYM